MPLGIHLFLLSCPICLCIIIHNSSLCSFLFLWYPHIVSSFLSGFLYLSFLCIFLDQPSQGFVNIVDFFRNTILNATDFFLLFSVLCFIYCCSNVCFLPLTWAGFGASWEGGTYRKNLSGVIYAWGNKCPINHMKGETVWNLWKPDRQFVLLVPWNSSKKKKKRKVRNIWPGIIFSEEVCSPTPAQQPFLALLTLGRRRENHNSTIS